ncbi:MAG: hypothetical protein ACLSW7_12545 [Acutalibacteraceae bacterium]|nr:hypothetical protein [Clostridiales bacterium]
MGCARALSGLHFRSVLHDAAVCPAYQRWSTGSALAHRCVGAYPDSERLVQTDTAAGFCERLGFWLGGGAFLTRPSKWF